MIEVERKFKIKDIDSFYKIIESYSLKPINHQSQTDLVFLKNIKSFKDFNHGDPVIRIRQVNNKAHLTYKKAVGHDGNMLEYELEIKNAETMKLILEQMEFNLVTKVTKDRQEYRHKGVTIAIDNVIDLGWYVEFEIICDNNNVKDAEDKIYKIANKFNLNISDIEKLKYDKLINLNKV